MAKGRQPDYAVYVVEESGRERFWHKVGSAWANDDGQGISVTLVALPFSGRLVLRVPKTETDGGEVHAHAANADLGDEDTPY